MQIRDRIKELRRVPANELLPNPKNWRTHPAKQLDALRGVLAEIGFAGAELARELPDGSLMLIDGHARAEVAGSAVVPVLVLDVDEAEADKILATFDPLGAMAGADTQKLDSLLREVQTSSVAVADMLTTLAEKNNLLEDLTKEKQQKEIEKLDKALQLTPDKEYVVVMCDSNEEWEEMKGLLELQPVRRGGYKEGSPFESVGTQRVLKWEEFKERLK